jgi:hypothetical protein
MIKLSNENKILLLILLVAALLFFQTQMYNLPTETTCHDHEQNEKSNSKEPYKSLSNNFNDNINEKFGVSSNFDTSKATNTSNNGITNFNETGWSNDLSKMEWSNISVDSNNSVDSLDNDANSLGNEYKSLNFSNGDRSSNQNTPDLDNFFKNTYVGDNSVNNGFVPMVDSNIGAGFISGVNKNLTDKDKFDPNSLLPKEQNSEWVDDPYDQINVKSSMVNIFRPTGINTTSTSKKFESLDIRGVPKTPKMNVSPWNNSSVDGGNNLRSNALC